MSLDLTGGLLISFILDEIRPVLARHPRYRDNDGAAFQTFANMILFRDVSVTLGGLRGDATRYSPDNYMGTFEGRTMVARIDGKPGTFIEWAREVDPSGADPKPGMYLLHVDSVDEQTREVQFITQALRTIKGGLAEADGTVIVVDPSIPIRYVQPSVPGVGVEKAGTTLWLLDFVESLDFVRTDTGETLTPGEHWKIRRTITYPLGVTTGSSQAFDPPEHLENLTVLSTAGRTLRQGVDWAFNNQGRIEVPRWTPPGETWIARGVGTLDPRSVPLIHPENRLEVALGPGETLADESIHGCTPEGDFGADGLVQALDGGVYLRRLLTPGDLLEWEAQASTSQVFSTAKKMEMTTELIPGMHIAIGDAVTPNDQCCVVVSPEPGPVYRIFGGKDGVGFDLTVKSNDLSTTTELASMLRRHLMIEGRDRMESVGVNIQTVSYSYQGEQRDPSGTAMTHSGVLNVTLSADWELHLPIVDRVKSVGFDLVVAEGFVRPSAAMAGRTQFLTSYY